ncbi:MAG TPA: four helix bundle protein [Thermoleophilaceae bacterium]|jgi:four helix bundle protein
MVVPSDFQRLRVYRLAVTLADEIYESVARWPVGARASFGSQLIRAADSIGANIAEASGRYHPADRRRLLVIARGSLHETEHWMNRAETRGVLPRGSTEQLEEIARLLNGLIKRPT